MYTKIGDLAASQNGDWQDFERSLIQTPQDAVKYKLLTNVGYEMNFRMPFGWTILKKMPRLRML
jgi:hypothetical protein